MIKLFAGLALVWLTWTAPTPPALAVTFLLSYTIYVHGGKNDLCALMRLLAVLLTYLWVCYYALGDEELTRAFEIGVLLLSASFIILGTLYKSNRKINRTGENNG